MPDIGLKTIVDRTRAVSQALNTLASTRVMVGIPAEKAGRRNSPIDNAALGYIHELGAPEANIPARPFLVPGVASAQREVEGYLRQASDAAFDGNMGKMLRALNAAGLKAATAVKKKISEGIPPPLKPSTIRKRRIRSPGSSYRRKATGAGDVKPLIDTAQMLRAITYVLRKV